jgi:thiol:disulfide interchange protein
MRKTRLFIAIVVLLISGAFATAQQTVKLYDDKLDGMKQLQDAVKKAKSENKHVFVQFGGNWCVWCIKFDAFCKADEEITKFISDNFVTIKVNWSPENKNEPVMKHLENPGRFGYPVFIIVDGNGKRLHTQDSALLEEGDGYSKKKILSFLKGWSPAALK